MSDHRISTEGSLHGMYVRRQVAEKVRLIESSVPSYYRSALLLEAIDENELNALVKKLDTMEKIAGSLGLDELNNGVQKAKQRARMLVNGGIKGGILQLTSKIAPEIAGLASFESGIINLFKQLPNLLKLVGDTPEGDQIGVPGARAADANASLAASTGMKDLDTAQRRQLKPLILKAMKPSGVLGFFRGLPWINDELLADEILVSNASPAQFSEVAKSLGDVPIDSNDATEIAKATKGNAAERSPEQIKGEPGKKPNQPTAKGHVAVASMSAEQFAAKWNQTDDTNKRKAVLAIAKSITPKTDARVLYNIAKTLGVDLPA